MPNTLPAQAPTPKDGMNIPAGTLIPNVITVNPALTIIATRIARIIGQTLLKELGSRTHKLE
jgi:hypothetical protein